MTLPLAHAHALAGVDEVPILDRADRVVRSDAEACRLVAAATEGEVHTVALPDPSVALALVRGSSAGRCGHADACLDRSRLDDERQPAPHQSNGNHAMPP